MCQPRHRHVEWIKFLRLIDRRTPKHLSLRLALLSDKSRYEQLLKSVSVLPNC